MEEKIMLYGNLKNCTYTQTTGNCGAGVGFFIALLISKYNPGLIQTNGIILLSV